MDLSRQERLNISETTAAFDTARILRSVGMAPEDVKAWREYATEGTSSGYRPNVGTAA